MKKFVLLSLSFVLCFTIVGCTNQEKVDTKTVVWRIKAFSNDKEMASELVSLWEKPLNKMLKDKKADYQVKIIPFGYGENVNQIQELKEFKEKGKQTDVITILPDVISSEMTSWHNTYNEVAEQKLLLNLEEWQDKNKKELNKALTPYDFELSKVNGELFGISSNVPPISSVLYSKDKLNELGIKAEDIKPNLFDNMDLFLQVKQSTNEFPIKKFSRSIDTINLTKTIPSNNLTWKKDEGFVSITKTEEFKNLLEGWISLKDQGILEPEYKDNETVPFATTGFFSTYRREPFEGSYEYSSNDQKKADFVVIPDPNQAMMQMYWGDNKTGIASWSENTNNAEDFLLKLFTDKDIANLIQYGIEGKDYKLNENQQVTVTTDKVALRSSGYRFTNPKITYSTEFEEDDKLAYSNWFHLTYKDHFPTGFRFDSSSVLDEIKTTNELHNDNYSNPSDNDWINKLYSLDIQDMDSFIEELNSALDDAGMQIIVDEANKQYQHWLSENK